MMNFEGRVEELEDENAALCEAIEKALEYAEQGDSGESASEWCFEKIIGILNDALEARDE